MEMMGFRTYFLNAPGECKVSILLDEIVSFSEVETGAGLKVVLVHMRGGHTHCLSISFEEFIKNFPFQQFGK
jgi:hypothetical protein